MLSCDNISNIKCFWPVLLISNVSGQLLFRNFDVNLYSVTPSQSDNNSSPYFRTDVKINILHYNTLDFNLGKHFFPSK